MLFQLLLQFLLYVAIGLACILVLSFLFVTLVNLFNWGFPKLSAPGPSAKPDAAATLPPSQEHHHV